MAPHLPAKNSLPFSGFCDDYPRLPLFAPDYPHFSRFFVIVCDGLQNDAICVNCW